MLRLVCTFVVPCNKIVFPHAEVHMFVKLKSGLCIVFILLVMLMVCFLRSVYFVSFFVRL